jgi:prolyl-tRNA synthetase
VQPTSEEVVTDVMRQDIKAEQLPKNLRSRPSSATGIAPHFGLMRGREFLHEGCLQL